MLQQKSFQREGFYFLRKRASNFFLTEVLRFKQNPILLWQIQYEECKGKLTIIITMGKCACPDPSIRFSSQWTRSRNQWFHLHHLHHHHHHHQHHRIIIIIIITTIVIIMTKIETSHTKILTRMRIRRMILMQIYLLEAAEIRFPNASLWDCVASVGLLTATGGIHSKLEFLEFKLRQFFGFSAKF